jgi:pimeloyl-ACP methyl ester carboxylesterase
MARHASTVRPAVASRLMQVDGLWFRVLGSTPNGDAGPVHVLVHGIGTSHRYLSFLHAELARHGAVLSIDLPGFGGLPTPERTPSVEELSSLLGEVLDRLGVSAAVLVGHSMGAQWVVELAARRPELASGVVIIGPVSDDRHRSLRAQAVALGLDILSEPPLVNAVVFQDYLRCGPVYFLREAGPMVSYPIEERVAELEAPLLVIRGGHDPIAGTAWCRRLRDRAGAGGGLAVVPGHGHVVQHSAPRAVASAVLARESIVRESVRRRTDVPAR